MIKTYKNINLFLKTEIDKILIKKGYNFDENLKFYMVNLVASSVCTSKLFEFDEPLSVILLESLNLNKRDKIEKLRYVGDFSLIITSFFIDYFNKKTIKPNYYNNLGKIAYMNLFLLTKNDVYKSIHENYNFIVIVLKELKF